MADEKEDWFPTASGTTTAYEAEYRRRYWLEGEERWIKWAHVPSRDVPLASGIPYPLCSGGVFQTIGLHGHEQAQALAWCYAASAAAAGERVEVRVVTYELKYDIKAKRRTDAAHDEKVTK